jgi:hypothetical protein
LPDETEKSWPEDITKASKDKGLWRASIRVIQDVTSLGGAFEVRRLREQLDQEAAKHAGILAQVRLDESLVRAHIVAIGLQLESATEFLDRAHALLSPVMGRRKARVEVKPFGEGLSRRSTHVELERFTSEYRGFVQTATGAGAGGAAAAGLWAAVQILGQASTGAAMASLHGAAATSAAWAWFGGGALAAGGGGMALGHIVLPGLGTAIAVGVSAALSYREAGQLRAKLEELERTNRSNLPVMLGTSEARTKYADAEQKLCREVTLLSAAVQVAQRRLRRFRFLSDLVRRLRFHLLGHYYTSTEMQYVVNLEQAVDSFIATFCRRSKPA